MVRTNTSNPTFLPLDLLASDNSARYATHMSDLKPSLGSATNAISVHTEDGALSVARQVRFKPFILAFWRRLIQTSGISDAYYCAECTRLEKDRDGCPKIVNLGASRTDLFYERRRLGRSIYSQS